MPTYAIYGGWVISINAGWIEVIADTPLSFREINTGNPCIQCASDAASSERYPSDAIVAETDAESAIVKIQADEWHDENA
jgi:hypothetical protein